MSKPQKEEKTAKEQDQVKARALKKFQHKGSSEPVFFM